MKRNENKTTVCVSVNIFRTRIHIKCGVWNNVQKAKNSITRKKKTNKNVTFGKCVRLCPKTIRKENQDKAKFQITNKP